MGERSRLSAAAQLYRYAPRLMVESFQYEEQAIMSKNDLNSTSRTNWAALGYLPRDLVTCP